MGAYAPLDWLPAGTVDDVLARVAQPTVDEMARRGTPFSGLLYVGLAMTASGPRVIEFNARFGDPETQVVLALLESPLSALLFAAATGELAALAPLSWHDGSAVTVVIAAAGYPGTPRAGDVIEGAERSGVIHAGTRRRDDGALVSSGGRVLSVTATGPSLADARRAAYAAVADIRLPGGQYRTDIALRAVAGDVVPGVGG
jgi:phosphoribosylamine--glycine ligase